MVLHEPSCVQFMGGGSGGGESIERELHVKKAEESHLSLKPVAHLKVL